MNYNEDVQYWIDELEDARKRDKDFRKDGKSLYLMYDGEEPDKHPYNILYSNTETLKPALYSNLPKPQVKPRFVEKDLKGLSKVNPLDKAVCEASNYMLSYLIDSNVEGYESFHDSIKECVLDALIPGRGVSTVKFDAKVFDDEVEWASICLDTKKYTRFLHGFATKWSEVPWIAYEFYSNKEDAEKLFGDVEDIQFSISDEDEKHHKSVSNSQKKTACFYQIWNKETKTIIYISEASENILREDDDPLEINGFFNTPKPLMLHTKSNNLKPSSLYSLYENQAKELDRLTRSINKVAHAMKVRGGYDAALGGEFERILDEEENTFVPMENIATMLEGGIEKHIWTLPLGELAGVLQQLYVAREGCKQVIYEITGISDILRGSSKASETLGAQKVKEAWGTLRLKDWQGEVQTYVRDVLRIMLDVAVKNLPQSIWMKVTGLPYPTKEQKEKATEQLNKVRQMIDPQKPDERIAKQVSELTNMLALPSWEAILETLKDDYIRSYKVDIETNSTLDIEATEDKKYIGEAMNAMAQFMNGLMPMVKAGVLPFPAAKSMLIDIANKMRFGEHVIDEIQAMEPPQDQEQVQQQIEEKSKQIQQAQKQIQGEKEKLEAQQKKISEEFDEEISKLEQEKMQFEYDKKLFQEQQKMLQERMRMQNQLDQEKLTLKDQIRSAQHEVTQTKAESKLQNMIEKHGRNVQSIADKQLANTEKVVSDIKAQAEIPTSRKKVVKLIYGEDGKPVGADIQELEEEASGDVEFTYNEEGRPDGAVIN